MLISNRNLHMKLTLKNTLFIPQRKECRAIFCIIRHANGCSENVQFKQIVAAVNQI